MAFDELLGNYQLKENLTRSIQNGHVSHFYLICGPEGSGRHTLARLLAAAIVCQDSGKPCLRCNPCRKVLENNHPDFITVEDPEHKTVPVKMVRQYREDMFIRPNEADRKIYFFPQELGIEGQNALLKILEEPPSYGVFILLTDNPERLLPTVRSRCTELTLRPLDAHTLKTALARKFPKAEPEALSAAVARSGGFLGQAVRLMTDGMAVTAQTEDFASAFGEKNALLLASTLAPMEKWKRDAFITELEAWLQLLENALAYRSGMNTVSPAARDIGTRRSSTDLMDAISAVQTGIEYAQSNVSIGAVCGWLSRKLR